MTTLLARRIRAAGCAHATAARPSTITVHAPHEPSGAQPSFIERRPSRVPEEVEEGVALLDLDGDGLAVERQLQERGYSAAPRTSASSAIRMTTPLNASCQ